ncbi:MAG: hypothetical protein KKA81_15995, partial [Bacteroidetes bacterium]|nr:hypothetical protein [Bacteroidota bacterium]
MAEEWQKNRIILIVVAIFLFAGFAKFSEQVSHPTVMTLGVATTIPILPVAYVDEGAFPEVPGSHRAYSYVALKLVSGSSYSKSVELVAWTPDFYIGSNGEKVSVLKVEFF